MKIGNIEIQNTSGLRSPETRICALISAIPKIGKTTLAGSLNEFTLAVRKKPTLFIAVEAAEGGGTMSIAGLGVDYVTPKNYAEMDALIGQLATDTTYGGIVLDNGTDYISRIVKPYALTFPSKERDPGTRVHGVPVRGDYQTMAEQARKQLNGLVNLTNRNTPPEFRKDLIVTSLERELKDDVGNLTGVVPDFPGALSGAAAALFQSVLSIRVRPRSIPGPDGKPVRISERVLQVKADGIRPCGDRSGIFEHDWKLTAADGSPVGILAQWEKWVAGLPQKELA